ncbi:ProQ/FINO family protein [Halomonas saccharevitans]|uniref:ProQ/FINO family protein n=1 Tax=Halomonas saccharevitans TaxID=416872 RepID=A0A1I6Y302_9GAMM|nr:ProQ/FINO family protein [Halomonas saccharevitans]SFT44464.1 ProQ/FINO family protein [Halomonas saccharevitans]
MAGDGGTIQGQGALEGQDVIEEGLTRLLERLEQRAAALLSLLRESRVQQDALQSRLAELERRRVELEASHAERAAEAREEQAAHQALAQRCQELEARIKDLDATRLELVEENRELDEQNRELESHNRRLLAQTHSPAEAEAGTVLFHRQARRAQGLSALIGERPRRQPADDAVAESSARDIASEPPAATAGSTGGSAASADDEHEAPAPARVGEPSEPSEPSEANAPHADEAPSPQALLDQWYRRYSSTFFKGHTRPLKIGIHEELTAREPWPEKLVRRALACYVNLPRYLKSVREGAWRLDLAGEPAGQVDAAAAEHAHKKLERLQADRRERGRTGAARGNSRGGAKRQGGAGGQARHGSPRADDAPPGGKGNKTNAGDSRPAQSSPSATRPSATPSAADPASLDEKLSALLAKHNQR